MKKLSIESATQCKEPFAMAENVPNATAVDKALTAYELLLFSKEEHSAQ